MPGALAQAAFFSNFSLGQAPSDRQGALTFCGDLPKPTEKQGGSNSLRKVWDRSYEGTLGFARPLSKRDDKFKVDSGQITRAPSAPKFTDHAPKILILQIARIPSPKEVRSHIGPRVYKVGYLSESSMFDLMHCK